jgi:tripartite-type tricarboxylate transporter receptor subunit TctC
MRIPRIADNHQQDRGRTGSADVEPPQETSLNQITRRSLAAFVAASGLAFASVCAIAQDGYPSRPIRVVVPYSAGGNTDIITRDVMKELSVRLRQPVIIDNKPGANSILGTDLVAKSAPDGYTLLVVIGAYANNSALYKNLPYASSDLVPVTQLTRTSLVLVTAQSGVRNMSDLVRFGRDGTQPLSFASSGVGSAAHLLGERFARAQQMKDAVHIPYKGSADTVADLVSGRVSFMFDAISAMGPQIRQGRLTALAVTGQERSPLLPLVPSVKEVGLPQLVSYVFAGVLAPARTPQPIVDRLSRELAEVLRGAELRTKLAAINTDAVGSTPAEFGAFLGQESKINGDVIRQLGITLD